ncbi:Tad domain-containing protein [Vibrio tapetis]|uniref:VWFA domain-containing protein n=1 Tax=Vibrio tapetis subsp. tapetis TaxID=1671868 RepID=A0A2N8ZDF7_9VIBR|nr:Tad domain-containing protein [Vibrio tapetis]SON49949.1 conserved exported protein of unknown function [Vibrio tapetis subsp. tapetis]
MKCKCTPSLSKQQGSGTVLMVTFVILMMVMFFVSISATRLVTMQTRLNHSVDAALALVAREGVAVTEAEGQYLVRTFIINNSPVGIRDQAVKTAKQVSINLSNLGYSEQLRLNVSLPIQPFVKDVPVLSAQVSRELLRQYPSTETVLSLDLSSSMSSKLGGGKKPSEIMPDILNDFIDSLTGEVAISKDHHIGLVPYSGYVNVGKAFQDRLITPQSRRVPEGVRPTARMHGYDGDFLHRLGVEGKRSGACVARKPYKLNNPNDILRVPNSARQGFELVINYPGSPFNNDLRQFLIDLNSGFTPDHMLPFIQKGPKLGEFIGSNGSCPSMALMPITDDTLALKDRADDYYPTHVTGGDEGVIWAWRLLDPKWRSTIWPKVNQALKAPKRRVIMFTDGANNKGVTKKRFVTLLSTMCRSLHKQGIKMDAVIFDQGVKRDELQAYRQCAALTGGTFNYVKGDDLGALRMFFARLAIRQYQVRYL